MYKGLCPRSPMISVPRFPAMNTRLLKLLALCAAIAKYSASGCQHLFNEPSVDKQDSVLVFLPSLVFSTI
ncbi:hypothetical protein C0J52_07070 [Blattella germanica]|nr:hypothetical protein C0J52_07070 [Blattella germanica]